MEKQTEKKRMSKGKKARIIIIAVVVFFLISNTIATKIIYDNIFKRYDKPVYENLMTEQWLSMKDSRKELNILSTKGNIQGCLYEGVQEAVTSEALVVIAPGLHAGMDNYIGLAATLVEEGYDVVSFDPIGTRESEGKSCYSYSQEIYDLDAVLDYAQELKDYEKIYIIGHSRGATAACALLDTTKPELSDHGIDGVIAIAGFNSAMDAVIGLSSGYVGPVANLNYPTLWAYQLTLCDFGTLQIRVDEVLKSTEIPVLVLQGEKDETASASQYSIYSVMSGVTAENKTAKCFKEYGHNDILYDENGIWNEQTMELICTWLEEN